MDKADVIASLVSCEINSMQDGANCLQVIPCQTFMSCCSMDAQAREMLLDAMTALEVKAGRPVLSVLDCRFLRAFRASMMKLFLELEIWSKLRAFLAVRDDGGERNRKKRNNSDEVRLYKISEVHERATSYYLADRLVSIVQTVGTTSAWKGKAAAWLAEEGGADWLWVVVILVDLMSILGHLDGANLIIKSKGKVRWVLVRLSICFLPELIVLTPLLLQTDPSAGSKKSAKPAHTWDAQQSSNPGESCEVCVEGIVSTVAKRLDKDSKAEAFEEFAQFIVHVVEEVALMVYENLPEEEQEGVTAGGLIELAVESARLKLPTFGKNMVTLFSKERLTKFEERIEAKTRAAEAAAMAAEGAEHKDEEDDNAGGMVEYLMISWTHL